MPDARTVLLFGALNTQSKFRYPVCRDVALGMEAYERYQLSAYMPEIIALRKRPDFVDERGIFAQLVALVDAISADVFCELGSTLFSSIDRYENCRSMQQAPQVSFVGVEPSRLLREAAEVLHPNHPLRHFTSHQQVPALGQRSVGRSYQASSYAFATTQELARWLSQFGASQDGIWFSVSGHDEHHEILGSLVTLFSFGNFCSAMQEAGFTVNVLSAQKVAHIECELLEVFVTCFRKELIRKAGQTLVEGDLSLSDHSVSDFSAVSPARWKEPRAVNHHRASVWDAFRWGRTLNFAGAVKP